MKVLKLKYPKGTFKGQKTDGRYIDGFLYENLKLLATKIVDDMTFLGVASSSTLEVGTGKTVLLTQIGEVWTEIMKEVHNIDVPFALKNVVFRPEELIERAFDVPKYSCLLLDEWEDLHYWSNLGKSLRKFFRKCRQLNLFILVIIPNFFQLPINYAIGRSIFFIDIKFDDNLERGNYDFYGFKAKKNLYIKGKKFQDYGVQLPDFQGEFMDGYGVPEAAYRRVKYEDMLKYDTEGVQQLNPVEIREIKYQLIREAAINSKGKLTQSQIAQAFNLSASEISRIISGKRGKKTAIVPLLLPSVTYNIKQIQKDDYIEENTPPQLNPEESIKK